MKKYIGLCCMVLLIVSCNGSTNYPLDIEFRVEGSKSLTFSGYYGYYDNYHIRIDSTVPVSFYLVLDDHEIAECCFVKPYAEKDTLTVSLFVDGDLFETETITYGNVIQLFYPGEPITP